MGAVGDGVADDSAALKAAMDKLIRLDGAGIKASIYAPAGIYRIGNSAGAMPVFHHIAGAIYGDGIHKTYFKLDRSFSGDLFAWSEAWMGDHYTRSTLAPDHDMAGPAARDFTVIGNSDAPNIQNVFRLYDRNDNALFENIEIFSVHGQAISIGRRLNTPEAYLRESAFYNIKSYYCGTPALAPIEISSFTRDGSDATNELDFYKLAVFAAPGAGVVESNPNRWSATRAIRFFGLRSEGNGGDGVRLGLATDRGQTGGIDIYNLDLADVAAGFAGLRIASGAEFQPYAIAVWGGYIQGAGIGVSIDTAARQVRLGLQNIATTDKSVYFRASGANVSLEGGGAEADWTYGYAEGVAVPLHMRSPASVHGIPAAAKSIGLAAMKAVATGTRATRLTMDGAAPNAVNSFNPSFSQAFTVSIQLIARNRRSGAWYAWTLPQAVLTDDWGAKSVRLTAGRAAVLTGGATAGAEVTIAADTTHGGLALFFTPPAGNSEIWDATANIQFAQAP